MSNVINKVTGQYLTSVNTPDYKSKDWIINPSQAEIDQYTKVPEPVDPKIAEKEVIIQAKIRELAIEKAITDGDLDSKGDVIG